VTIAVGGTVSFSWSGDDFHDVSVVGGGSLAGCATVKIGSCSQSFPTAGTYNFICAVHPATMKEAVTVQ
jgi:plastocyanin